MHHIFVRWTFAASTAVCLALGCAGQHVSETAEPAASSAPTPQTETQPEPEPQLQPEPEPAVAVAPPTEAAASQQQLAPAGAPEPEPEPEAPAFKRRKHDDIWIRRGGLTIGLPEAARTSFDQETMNAWSDALFDAMDGCYKPALERNPKLVGSVWSTLALRARGQSAFSLQPAAGALKGVASCLRKRLPKPPLATIAGAEGTYSVRLQFVGLGPRDPMLR